MNKTILNAALHVSEQELLERSRWYGPNLLTFLAKAEETNGAFTLIKCTLRRGFEPPLHVHSREEESSFIIDGEILYEVDSQTIHTRPGNFIRLPREIPHRFKLITETATLLLWITPSGFEEMFMRFSQPALTLDLPAIPTQLLGKEFFEAMNLLNTELGVTMFPDL